MSSSWDCPSQGPDFEEFFPVGQRVRCQSEMWEKRPEMTGTVEGHRLNSYGNPQWMAVRLDPDECGSALVEYDYRYLDIEDSRNSLVKRILNDN